VLFFLASNVEKANLGNSVNQTRLNLSVLSTDCRHGESHVTTGDPRMHVADFSSASAVDDRGETATARHRNVDGQFARRQCASCSVRQVALGAIVASHLYNEAQRSSVDDDVLTGSSQSQHRSLYA